MIPDLNTPGPGKYYLRHDIVAQLEAEEATNPGSVRLCPHGMPLSIFGRLVKCPACSSKAREAYTQAATGREKLDGPAL